MEVRVLRIFERLESGDKTDRKCKTFYYRNDRLVRIDKKTNLLIEKKQERIIYMGEKNAKAIIGGISES